MIDFKPKERRITRIIATPNATKIMKQCEICDKLLLIGKMFKRTYDDVHLYICDGCIEIYDNME